MEYKKNTPPSSNNQRVIGLDFLRIGLALFVFFFHSRVHLGCDYGLLNYLFDSPYLGMSGFFMLSGYALTLAYNHKNLFQIDQIKVFFVKRFISIYPLYIITFVLSVILSVTIWLVAGGQKVTDTFILLPVEVLGVQSFFDGALFSYANNGGTWFISCLFVCYFLFPLLKALTDQMSFRGVWLAIIILVAFQIYVHFLPSLYECGILYTNPLFRVLEVSLGMLLAKLNLSCYEDNRIMKIIRSWPMLLLMTAVLLVGCSFCRYNGIKSYFLIYICFVFIFLGLGHLKFPPKIANSKTIIYLSGLTYAFYLFQGFVWPPMKFFQQNYGEFCNAVKIILSLTLCFAVAAVFHELIENKIGLCLKKRIL